MAIMETKSRFSVWKLFLAVFFIVVIAVAVVFGTVLSDVKHIHISQDMTVDIPEGAGAASVAEILYDDGIIKYPNVFKLISKTGGYDANYQPGVVNIKKGMGYSDILKNIVKNDRNVVTVVIPEGYTIKQIAEKLSDEGICSVDEFNAALDPSLYDYRFLKDLPDRENKLEGYLFPATYEMYPGMAAKDIVDMMLRSFDNVFTDEYYKRAEEVNVTVDEVVTMASIVERETNDEGERAKVAGVFYNRINKGMKLESCATVQYILGENKAVLSVSDTKIQSPYNTYVNTGLPVGPIANPGADCIKAALYPEKTDALYFVLGADGEHIFSKTYEEHLAAMEANGL